VTAATTARTSGRGRQSPEVEDLRDVRDDLAAERRESIDFGLRVLAAAKRLELAVITGDLAVVDQAANELGFHAGRFLRQRSSSVL
jgi:hypothetical protein